jgi:hypothetical protein
MRSQTVLVALAAAGALLTACGRDEPKSVTVAPLPPDAEAAPKVTSEEPPRTVEGRYGPLSDTAEAVTGGVTVSRDGLSFDRGQQLATSMDGLRFSNERYGVETESWASAMQVPEFTLLEVRRVDSSKAPAGGGLCGDQSVTFVALAMEPQDGGTDELAVAAFTGELAPGPEAPGEALCASFRYARE